VFPNTDEALSPGLFARIRVPIGQAHRGLLVADRAIDTDQGQKVLYVVDEKNEVASRAVRLGARHDGLREITEGLEAGERVIVSGLQQVRPGLTVEPKPVDMPNGSQGLSEKRGLRSEGAPVNSPGRRPWDHARIAKRNLRAPEGRRELLTGTGDRHPSGG
jgi:hypothetical protein